MSKVFTNKSSFLSNGTTNKKRSHEEITLRHIDAFRDVRLDCNIFLNEDYAPFQLETRFYDIIDAHPVAKCRKFLIKALTLGNEADFYAFVKLEKEISFPPKDLNEE